MDVKLSVLDLIPTRTGQTTAQALAASSALARAADDLGYTRYWVAEHHNMPAVASTVPGVLIPYLAAGTTRIRFGSGGVMLPNHAALAVAEQFALLEAMFPGRIDLGIGRAPGSDPITSYLLRDGIQEVDAEGFERDVTLVRALLQPDAAPDDPVPLTLAGHRHLLRPTPRAASTPDLWLLGSSGFTAALAARLGLPYVFANHFGIPGVEQVLAQYRRDYQPSERYPHPVTLLPVNVVVGDTDEDAWRQARPQALQMIGLRTNAPLRAQLTVEQAEAHEWTPIERQLLPTVTASWMVGRADAVLGRLRDLARRLDVDELMILPVNGASEATPLDSAPSRVRTLEALAPLL